MQNDSWLNIDDKHEVKYLNKIKFIRPKNTNSLPVECPCCKQLVSTIEDCLSLKDNNLCEDCFVSKTFNNKDNN